MHNYQNTLGHILAVSIFSCYNTQQFYYSTFKKQRSTLQPVKSESDHTKRHSMNLPVAA